MSRPINDYSAKGDSEVIPRGLPSSNHAFTSAGITGVETNHSSLTPSISSPGGVSSQWDDDEDSVGHAPPGFTDGDDPNMSGPHPTEQANDWQSGNMNSFQDNNDYQAWAHMSTPAESEFGGDKAEHQGEWSGGESMISGIVVSLIVRR